MAKHRVLVRKDKHSLWYGWNKDLAKRTDVLFEAVLDTETGQLEAATMPGASEVRISAPLFDQGVPGESKKPPKRASKSAEEQTDAGGSMGPLLTELNALG